MNKTYVTKSYLPTYEEFSGYAETIWKTHCLTNFGTLEEQLRDKLQKHLHVPYIELCANGTLALQLALKACNVAGGEVITTPFTYVATATSILWEHAQPVFADIDPETLCLDPQKVAQCFSPHTKAVLGVHVFGIPCCPDELQVLCADAHIPLIYDAAHAFNVEYADKSLLTYGDMSTCSFHATKIFHTAEGGAVVTNSADESRHIRLLSSFGHIGDEYLCNGINAKMSELHAAMGLAVFNNINESIKKRKEISAKYDDLLSGKTKPANFHKKATRNYSYYPVLFENEQSLLAAKLRMEQNGFYSRRYFWPSLHTLPYMKSKEPCPASQDISSRILCLPLHHQMDENMVETICGMLP